MKINGLSIFTKLKPGVNQFMLDQQVQLSVGSNTVQIFAANGGGETSSAPRIITFEPPTKTNVSWIYPADNYQTFTASLPMKACVQSKSVVKRLQVFNNGIPVIDEANPQNEQYN